MGDSARSRKEELEKKRAKLEELRRAKQQNNAYASEVSQGDSSQASPRQAVDADEILKQAGLSVSRDEARKSNGDPRNVVENGDGVYHHRDSPATTRVHAKPATVDASISTDPMFVSQADEESASRAKETVAYSKETQTSGMERTEHRSGIHDYYDVLHLEAPAFEWDEEFPVLHYDDGGPTKDFSDVITDVYELDHIMSRSQQARPKPALDQLQSVEEDHDTKQPPPEITAEQKQELMLSEDFRRFFDKASRIVERALAEDDTGIDIFVDYKGDNLGTMDGTDTDGLKVTVNRIFTDERNVNGRGVSCLDISSHYPELVIASYHNPEEYSTEPGGLANVWNLRFKKNSPEDFFRCHSTLTAVSFAEFHPNLILGGTYSGQIVVWDNRTSKRTPINKSPVAVSTHCHPIFYVKVMGSSHAHNLVTASTDGRICSWSLDMLSQPQESLDLTNKQSKVSTTCLSFPSGNINSFLAGAEEGTVFAGCRHGSKPGITDIYEGHYGPVTSLSNHPRQDLPDFSHLFLTSSYDWTVKLWSAKEKKPVYSFEAFSDNVYDAKWSPLNPAIFATIDGGGSLDFWNLNQETEIPILRVPIEGAHSASRLMWTPNGQQLLVGDNSGRLHVFDVKEVYGSRAEDLNYLKRTIQELRQRTQVTEEAESQAAAVSNTHMMLDALAAR